MPIKHHLTTMLIISLVLGVLGSAGGALAQGMPERITIQSTDFFPSALTYDPARDQFLVASAQGGGIYAVGADGTLTAVVSDASLIAVQSLYVDQASDSLIVVDTSGTGLGGGQGFGFGGGRLTDGPPPDGSGNPPADMGTPGAAPDGQNPDGTPGQGPNGAPGFNAENFDATTTVHVYSLATGETLRTIDLSGVAPDGLHLGGDVALDAAGNIYVADQLGGVIYRIDTAGGTYYLQNAAFTGNGMGMGLNGIVYDSASNSLLVTPGGAGALWRVSLSDPSNPVQVTLPAEITALRNVMADGAGNLLATTGGRDQQTMTLVKLGSTDGWASASVVAQVELTEMGQAAVLRGSDVYVLSGGGFGGFGRGTDGTPVAPDANATPSPIEIVRVASGL